jgi:hypothetical protein
MIYERIEKSLNQAIKLHNSGMGANDSIIKIAKENELNPETICRVVEAFNIAKTKAYVKVAEDKAGDFDVADKKKLLKEFLKTLQSNPRLRLWSMICLAKEIILNMKSLMETTLKKLLRFPAHLKCP